MTWEEYYDKFYDWSENTQVNKLSSVESLGSADEVAEVMMELAFHHEDAVNRIARKAIEQQIVRSGIINSKKLQDRLHRRRMSGVN